MARQQPESFASKKVVVRPGQAAIAPRVDDPRGFAAQNDSGMPLTVSFSYDEATHVMTVVIDGREAAGRLPRDSETWSNDADNALPS